MLEISYTERKAKHTPSSWAMVMRCLFDETKRNLIITETY